ncbi:putative Ig domain-containing protein [Spirosoma utsteinense]|uniref:Dystroglycan-type cadherin-like domain-containing protein n=1 Tax=Spirosoma utsteinense TaxID=2585773 RepID=A0ABR6WBN8_9BACT|nr:putative Ig domain-containing protein [Spirosoma utsteinense]MBC3793980.1 hypothetical protein [Spirosoma utsteinense]
MNQQLRKTIKLGAWLMALLCAHSGWAQLLTDDFTATTLPYSLTAQGGWAAHSGAGTNTIQATAPGLTYSGIATAGGSVGLTTAGEDVNRQFTQQTSGSVYASFLINVAAAQATGDYFLHLGPSTIGTTFIGRVFVKSTTGGFLLGLSKGTDAAGPVYSTTVYSLNTTYLVVLKYTFVAGATNDLVDLFIQPTPGQAEPTPSVSTTSVVADLANAGSIALRQGTAANAPTLRVDKLQIGTSWSSVTSASTPVAALSTSTTALTGFVAGQGTVSNTQTYTLTGSDLSADPVSVSATAGIELSTDNSSFTPMLSLPTSASALSQVIYARLTAATPTGAFSGTITHTANATLVAPVTVSGQINAPNAPVLTAAPTTLTGYTTAEGTPSAVQAYTLTAANLTDGISVSASTGVDVSQTPGSGFGATLTLPSSTTSAVVYARLSGTAGGAVSGTITNRSGSLTAVVTVSGTVSTTGATPISTARVGIGQSFTVAGRVTVTNQLGARQLYIQDATGGIVIYSGPSGTDLSGLVQLGDSVRASGPVSVFSGYTEITASVNTFTVVTGVANRMVMPVAITPDQLPAYQGRLVSVADATITPATPTFTGGTSYTITAGGQSGTLRISANSPLAGAGRPTNPVSVTGIADRFVSGATTPGTNGLQLQPRILADVPGTTPASDLTCTVGSSPALGSDKTLDIVAWNFEFFGADAGTISCPSGTTLTYDNFGPTNELLQQTNATTVLTKLNADIIAAEEISDINRLDAAVKAMPGSYSYVCSDKFSYYFQNECDQTPSGGTVFGPTRLAQKVCVIYNTATVTPVLAETKALLADKYNYPSDNNWSSGRLPFLFVANVTIDGKTEKIHVVALHAKSGSATADYNRRKQDIIDLKAELDTRYADAKVVILGDYNDKLNGSIATGKESSYQSFVTDVTNYSAITLPLENQGCSTFNSSASFIDHIIASSELAKAYVSNSAYVLQPFSIPNYGNTTSDHNPVVARFDLSQFVAPVTALTLVASATPASILTTGTTTLSATVSGGTMPYTYTFTGPGSITATGNTAVVSGLTTGVQTFTVVAQDATAPTSQTVSGTVSVTVTEAVAAPFSITGVTAVSCVTLSVGQRQVSFTPRYTGLSGQPISFSVVNELSPTTATGPYTLTLYTDNPTITLKATQTGTAGEASFTYNWLAACNGGGTPPVNQAPVVAAGIPAQSATVGQAFTYVIAANAFSDPNGDALTYSVSGLPAGLSFTAPATISGTPSVSGVSTVTVRATDPGSLSVSTSFVLTVSSAGTTAPFSITGVTTVSCVTITAGQRQVSFTPRYAGLSGAAVTFSVANELSPTTAAGPYTLNLYTDNPSITLKATQTGTVGEASFVYNWLAACNGGGTPPVNQAPIVAAGIPAQSATVGQAFTYMIPANAFSDPNGDALTYSVSGLPAGLSFTAPATISGTPSVSGVSTVTVKATDPGSLSVSTSFVLTVSSASVVVPGGPFSITGVMTVSCVTVTAGQRQVSFTPRYAGLSGQPISFSVVNELSPTTAAGPYTLNLYTDNPSITLKATQTGTAGEASFTYNWLTACAGGSGRLGARPSVESELDVRVLGNPAQNGYVTIEVRGAAGQSLDLSLTNGNGQAISSQQIRQAASVEHHTFAIGRQSVGLLLLRVSIPGQSKTVKVINGN